MVPYVRYLTFSATCGDNLVLAVARVGKVKLVTSYSSGVPHHGRRCRSRFFLLDGAAGILIHCCKPLKSVAFRFWAQSGLA